jgi:hypothetical protein
MYIEDQLRKAKLQYAHVLNVVSPPVALDAACGAVAH